MPSVRIDILRGRSEDELAAIGACVHRCMVSELGVPERDHFQILTEDETLRFNRSYLDIARSDAWILVHITLASGRSTDAKKAFYAALSTGLTAAIGLDSGDLAIVLVENGREDWSFGRG